MREAFFSQLCHGQVRRSHWTLFIHNFIHRCPSGILLLVFLFFASPLGARVSFNPQPAPQAAWHFVTEFGAMLNLARPWPGSLENKAYANFGRPWGCCFRRAQ